MSNSLLGPQQERFMHISVTNKNMFETSQNVNILNRPGIKQSINEKRQAEENK